jgi:plasmid maintenance system killer protein
MRPATNSLSVSSARRSPRRVIAEHIAKLRDILARLDAVGTVDDMGVPGFKLHPLKGQSKGSWAVTVRVNWRVILLALVSLTLTCFEVFLDALAPALTTTPLKRSRLGWFDACS